MKRKTQIAISIAVVLTLASCSFGGAPTIEYQVKASFLYNFIQFVEWSDSTFATPEDSIIIAVYGEDKLGASLDSLGLAKAKGHPIKVKRCKQIEDIEPAHVLFLTNSKKSDTGKLLKKLNTEGMLTVGEETGFVRDGGMINFVLKENRVRFEINLDSASDSGLAVSSQLLKLAVKVYNENDRTNR